PDYESGGQEFESLRARHSRAKVAAMTRAEPSPPGASQKLITWTADADGSLPIATLLTNMRSQPCRKAGSALRSRRRILKRNAAQQPWIARRWQSCQGRDSSATGPEQRGFD